MPGKRMILMCWKWNFSEWISHVTVSLMLMDLHCFRHSFIFCMHIKSKQSARSHSIVTVILSMQVSVAQPLTMSDTAVVRSANATWWTAIEHKLCNRTKDGPVIHAPLIQTPAPSRCRCWVMPGRDLYVINRNKLYALLRQCTGHTFHLDYHQVCCCFLLWVICHSAQGAALRERPL